MKAIHRELLKGLPPGYRIGTYDRNAGHMYVLKSDGEPLRGADGVPVRVVGSPGDKRHSLKKNQARIRRALRG